MDTSEETNRTLEHVHMCVHCGSTFRRKEYEGRALTSGMYLCPKCGLEGPLNVQICRTDQLQPASTGTLEVLGIDSQRTLVTLADELSYVRAAEKLNITSSELESRIRALEKLLCCSLFQSTQKKLELTEEGRIFAHFCRRFIAYAERNKAENHDGKGA